jgi:hypothetical protein
MPGERHHPHGLFTSQEQPMAREWTATGTAVPAQAGIDSATETSQT